MAALLGSPHVFLISESGGFLMGRAVAGEAELLTLAVSPAWRRQGIGVRLVHRFLNEAKARATTTAFLEVAASNAPAIALYASTGFRPVGRRKAYYRGDDGTKDDALILSRAL